MQPAHNWEASKDEAERGKMDDRGVQPSHPSKCRRGFPGNEGVEPLKCHSKLFTIRKVLCEGAGPVWEIKNENNGLTSKALGLRRN